jgi:predicted ribosome quality control (RQC) complex YloA/Tae2 family protein
LQPLDFTTLSAVCHELRQQLLPARFEQAYQRDRYTLYLALRTLTGRHWLLISWHPQAARLGLAEPPPRQPDTFSLSQQLWHQLSQLALVDLAIAAPWERVVTLNFANRPGDPVLWQLYVEVMGQYSNVILVNPAHQIVAAAYQVSERQSRLRSIQTGDLYELPPTFAADTPSLEESYPRWREQLSLIPRALQSSLTKTYRGVSSALAISMLNQAHIPPDSQTTDLSESQWQSLFACWQVWLTALQSGTFQPGWTPSGYTVMGWDQQRPAESVQTLIDRYYTDQLNQQTFQHLRHQLQQRLASLLAKLHLKRQGFLCRLGEADRSEQPRRQADLLMAHLQVWQPGMTQIALPDFETSTPVVIPLHPEKNAVQNAQALYKQHQKWKRSRAAITPLLSDVQTEIAYLEQVASALRAIDIYQTRADLTTLDEIREELVQAGYLDQPTYRRDTSKPDSAAPPHTYHTPSGYDVLIGRNNRQNDQLTFRIATDYDLWFHTQEIPGSHVVLRLPPKATPDAADLQCAADLAAYFSQARESDQAPVIYTQPQHVYKPKGANLGMVIYKHERVIWGYPQAGKQVVEQAGAVK